MTEIHLYLMQALRYYGLPTTQMSELPNSGVIYSINEYGGFEVVYSSDFQFFIQDFFYKFNVMLSNYEDMKLRMERLEQKLVKIDNEDYSYILLKYGD